MEKLAQVFRNILDRPLIINLEMSTSRYRIEPGNELVLWYEPKKSWEPHGPPISIEVRMDSGNISLTVHTIECELFHTDGQLAEMNYEVG